MNAKIAELNHIYITEVATKHVLKILILYKNQIVVNYVMKIASLVKDKPIFVLVVIKDYI